MFAGTKLSTIFLAVFLIVAYIKVTESRPRMRHHRGDSGCNRCAPGWGVANRCTIDHDTKCEKCPQGTYSPHHNMQPCWICSRCGSGLYEAHPCSNGRIDTVCDSCHRPAPNNSDYVRKCKYHGEPFLAPEDASNTGEESSLVNNSNHGEIDEIERETILEEDAEAQIIDSRRKFESMQRL